MRITNIIFWPQLPAGLSCGPVGLCLLLCGFGLGCAGSDTEPFQTDAGVSMGGAGGGAGGTGGVPNNMGGTGGTPQPGCADLDRDGYQDARCNRNAQNRGGDCDDMNNLVNPGRGENCGNMIDNDCNGKTPDRDEACGGNCPDFDGDGYQDASCNADRNGNPKGGDCDDQDRNVNPGVMERCGNFKDDDCAGGDVPCRQNCTDEDLDGFGDGSGCAGADCDDRNATINPWASERCGDNIDQDCNGADRPCPEDCQDRDRDGFGEGDGCLDEDCNDRDPNINPGARELPDDGIDQDCDGRDLNLSDNCRDLDADGYGEGGGCINEDCDDGDPRVHRDRTEICSNGIDDDCVGGDRACTRMGQGECVDMDGDGWGEGGCLRGSPDCDDNDANVNPDANEVCDEKDNNCNGEVDECGRNQVCDGAACVGRAGAPCRADGECAQELGLTCDEDRRECRVADGAVCVENADCRPGAECILLDVCDEEDRRCYQAKGGPCEVSCDCTGEWLCHESNNRCVECVDDFNCDAPRDTCTEGGFCAETVTIGGAGEDAYHQVFRRLVACWNAWAESNESQACDVWLVDDTLEVGGMGVNALPNEDTLHSDGDPCDEEALAAAGFSGDDIEVLDEVFGGCTGVDFNLIEIFWQDQLPAGSTWCLYYAPEKSGFGFPENTRAALVVDRCDQSFFD